MKKIFSIAIVAIMLFALVACDNGEMQSKVDELEAKLQAQITQLEQKNEELLCQIEDMDNTISDLQQNSADTLEQNTQLQETIKALEKEISDLQNKKEVSQDIEGLESGFKLGAGECEIPSFLSAYRSDRTEFDINDVTLDFYYGDKYPSGIDMELSNGANIPVFEIYFSNSKGDSQLIKRVYENLVSEKYEYDYVLDENGRTTEIKFNHSETLTIPKDLFIEQSGVVYFEIRGVNIREIEPKMELIKIMGIYYKVVGDKVILSSQKFED